MTEKNVIFLDTLSFSFLEKRWMKFNIKLINIILTEKLGMCCNLSWHASLFPWGCTTLLITYGTKWNGKSLSWNGSFGASCVGEMFLLLIKYIWRCKSNYFFFSEHIFLGLYDLWWDSWSVNCKGNCCTALVVLYTSTPQHPLFIFVCPLLSASQIFRSVI